MQRILEIPWLRIGAESVAIIASILLAFSIDAWWAERVDRREQTVELGRLHAEFLDIRETVVADSIDRDERVSAVTELRERLDSYADRQQPQLVSNQLINRAVANYGNLDVATPILDGLILSGRLEGIRSQRVVTAIAEWRRAMSEIQANEQRSRDMLDVDIFPAFIARGDMSEAFIGPNPVGETELFVDDELRGHFTLRYRMTGGDATRLHDLIPIVDELLGAVEQALDN